MEVLGSFFISGRTTACLHSGILEEVSESIISIMVRRAVKKHDI